MIRQDPSCREHHEGSGAEHRGDHCDEAEPVQLAFFLTDGRGASETDEGCRHAGGDGHAEAGVPVARTYVQQHQGTCEVDRPDHEGAKRVPQAVLRAHGERSDQDHHHHEHHGQRADQSAVGVAIVDDGHDHPDGERNERGVEAEQQRRPFAVEQAGVHQGEPGHEDQVEEQFHPGHMLFVADTRRVRVFRGAVHVCISPPASPWMQLPGLCD